MTTSQQDADGRDCVALYVASRASVPERPQMWRDLRNRVGWRIVSSWIDESGEGQTDDFSELWERIQREISACDAVILFALSGDFPLKGAFIEVGMALMAGKPVAVVLPDVDLQGRTHKPVGSWIAHPQCRVFKDLLSAKIWIDVQVASKRPSGASDAQRAVRLATERARSACIEAAQRVASRTGERHFRTRDEELFDQGVEAAVLAMRQLDPMPVFRAPWVAFATQEPPIDAAPDRADRRTVRHVLVARDAIQPGELIRIAFAAPMRSEDGSFVAFDGAERQMRDLAFWCDPLGGPGQDAKQNWVSFADRLPPVTPDARDPSLQAPVRVFVTNNLAARDAMGRMSHVWFATPVGQKDGSFIAYDEDSSAPITDLTHWFDPRISG